MKTIIHILAALALGLCTSSYAQDGYAQDSRGYVSAEIKIQIVVPAMLTVQVTPSSSNGIPQIKVNGNTPYTLSEQTQDGITYLTVTSY